MKNTISKEELDWCLKNLDEALKHDIEAINNFNRSDLVRLEKAMVLNLYNLKKYDGKTLKLSNKLDLMYDRREALMWQTWATEEDIINNLSFHLKMLMGNVVFLSLISSHDVNDFMKKVAILLGIYLFTFKLNLLYFTSDKRKMVVEKKLSLLENNIIVSERYYRLYQKISNSFSLKLDIQYDKLLELYPEINESEVKIRRRK